MKNFIKTTLAVILGVFIVNFFGFIFFLSIIGSISSSTKTKPVLPKQGVLNVDLSSVKIVEQAADSDFNLQLRKGDDVSELSLLDAVVAINKAAKDPGVQYIYLRADALKTSLSSVEELRIALENFKSQGKAIIAYTEYPSNVSYYLLSVADKLYMCSNVGAGPMLNGFSLNLIFLKDLLDKLGVNVQLIRHGKFKSAGEMFIKNNISPENFLQNTEMINSIWGSCAEKIAKSRHISLNTLNRLINNLSLGDGKDMLKHSLVDGLLTKEELKEKLASFAQKEKFKELKFIAFKDYIKVKQSANLSSKNKLAVIYADGDIVEERDNKKVSGDRFASIISKVREDSTINAVILRVNSPGGSVLASDKIKVELDLLKKVKPVVASYGSYAASGGYWISSGCDKIFSNATTITGSIGVFSIVPDFSKTMKEQLKVTPVQISSHSHSGMYSITRPLDNAELDYLQASVEDTYEKFVSLVSKNRNIAKEYVDYIAQGRVWTGEQALSKGLVDEIGTLEDAIKYITKSVNAAKDTSKTRAAMEENEGDYYESWQIVSYPKRLGYFEELMGKISDTLQKEQNVFAATIFEQLGKDVLYWKSELKFSEKSRNRVYARLPFELVVR